MTEAGTRFVGPATFQALTGEPVFVDQWDTRIANGMAHIELSRAADAIVVAPASADFIASIAQGRAGDLLTTLCLARECPLAVAPAMNRQMWENPATRRNVQQVRDDGVEVIGPDSGDQACGETGMGRMLEPDALVEAISAWLSPKWLAGRRVLLTAGPTFEPIDPVRGITNRSSGKMGFAIAQACVAAGAEVTLIAGPVALPTPWAVRRIDVQTARQMYDAVHAEFDTASAAARSHDLFIAVAAVADWRPATYRDSKIKKTDDREVPELAFAQNPDILASVAQRARPPYCVGFAAESESLEAHGRDKLARKGIPMLVANIGHETFGLDDNELLILEQSGQTRLARAPKALLAQELVRHIAGRLG
jgi:phosphopantothenoylcysteine decarboxylase/phosphopantothenate--cysteine ligase